MRQIFLFIAFIFAFQGFSQKPVQFLMSGIVMNTDTVPIPGVAIVNIRTGKVMRTNSTGFFQAEMAPSDSLFVYHIAYKNKFIKAESNCRYIFLEMEDKQLMQVDVLDQAVKEQKYLGQTMGDALRIAPMKKLSGYDLNSHQEYFVRENGTHTKGFSPFFGPTIPIQFGKLEAKIAEIKERHILKKQTAHYHLEKNKKED